MFEPLSAVLLGFNNKLVVYEMLYSIYLLKVYSMYKFRSVISFIFIFSLTSLETFSSSNHQSQIIYLSIRKVIKPTLKILQKTIILVEKQAYKLKSSAFKNNWLETLMCLCNT